MSAVAAETFDSPSALRGPPEAPACWVKCFSNRVEYRGLAEPPRSSWVFVQPAVTAAVAEARSEGMWILLWERVCEHAFAMTSSGGSYSRFRRSLDNGNLLAARAAATELQHVGLAEALELTLLILAKEPTRFRAAALRWHARYCGDNRVLLKEATAVLGLLAMLDGRRGKTAAQALAGLLNSRTLLPASEVLMRWADKS